MNSTSTQRRRPVRRLHRIAAVTLSSLLVGTCGVSHAQSSSGPLPPPLSQSQDDSNEQLDYLTSGPLHEAFATPYEADPQPSELASQQPPEPIRETRPDYRPAGKNVQWIPGYWSFDDQRDDFVWVSGLWRDVPPRTTWIEGYWTQSRDGYVRVSGFWSKADQSEIVYLPTPPQSIEQGPSSPAPSDQHFYIPGCWVHQGNAGYAWRAGFWARQQSDWCWVPSSYVWTPRGTIYRDGYWDYAPASRGSLFAPVYFNQPIYRNANYRFQPRYALDNGLSLLVHLFVGPRRNQYYFGNYYDDRFRGRYTPWSQFGNAQRRGFGYDPLYTFFAANPRGYQQNVLGWVSDRHTYFQRNERFRPAPTVSAQRELLGRLAGVTDPSAPAQLGNGIDGSLQRLARLATEFDEVVSTDRGEQQFERLTDRQRDRMRDIVGDRREFARQRAGFESDSAARADSPVAGEAEDAVSRAESAIESTADAVGQAIDRTADQVADRFSDRDDERVRDRADEAAEQAGEAGSEAMRQARGITSNGRLRLPDSLRSMSQNERPGDQLGDQPGDQLGDARGDAGNRGAIADDRSAAGEQQPQREDSMREDSMRERFRAARPNLDQSDNDNRQRPQDFRRTPDSQRPENFQRPPGLERPPGFERPPGLERPQGGPGSPGRSADDPGSRGMRGGDRGATENRRNSLPGFGNDGRGGPSQNRNPKSQRGILLR